MEVVVFLFPVLAYVELLVCNAKDRPHVLHRGLGVINRALTEHRGSNRRIYAVHFGQRGNYSQPDLSICDPRIKIRPQDGMIVVDTSFDAFVTRDEEDTRPSHDPSWGKTLAQIPNLKETKRLIVGGFHYNVPRHCCVEEFVEKARQYGLPTEVDSRLTNMAFNES